MLINRRQVLIGSVGAAAGLTIVPAFGQVPPLKKKDTYKVGFAQIVSNNPWRLAETASMQDEAKKRGCPARLHRRGGVRRPSRSPTSTA